MARALTVYEQRIATTRNLVAAIEDTLASCGAVGSKPPQWLKAELILQREELRALEKRARG